MNHSRRVCYRLAILLGACAAGTMILVPNAAAAVYGGTSVKDGLLMVSGLGGIASSLSLTDLILTVIAFILNIVLLLAVAAIIVAGIYLIVSNGDEGQKDKAKNIVIYCIAGIVLILFSRVIVIVINNIF